MHAMLTTGNCLHTFSHLCFLEKTWAEAIRKVAAAFLKSLKLIGDPSETSQRFLCAGAVRERGQTGGESARPSNNSELGKVQRFPGGKMRFLFWNEKCFNSSRYLGNPLGFLRRGKEEPPSVSPDDGARRACDA